jgi:predicted AlkP superfamily pyrophosphatase or phosphodiesterase
MADRRCIRVSVAVWLAAVGLGAVPPAQAQVTAAVETVRPGRAHLVAAGTPTTFVLTLDNTSSSDRELTVRVDESPDAVTLLRRADTLFRPASAGVSELRLMVKAATREHVLAWITPSAGLGADHQKQVRVSAWDGGQSLGAFELGWRIRARPKLFYVVLDALGSGYLSLNRRGERLPAMGGRHRRGPVWINDPLMPRSLEFLRGAAWFRQARAVLPATTDPNHMAALTGSWPGTNGIHSVASYYGGRDQADRPITLAGSKELVRTGPQGALVRSVFDVAKDLQAGGSPDVFNLLISGKDWVGDLVADELGTVDIVASGKRFPSYVPPPPRIKLGDPASDPDAVTDREGTNLGPRPLMKRFSTQAQFVTAQPSRAPEDRWVAAAAVRAIMAEDPDVTYVVLAEVDTVQHVFGAADRPEEWADPFGTPNVLWDDTNVYNPQANRDPVLDVVHEADFSFGLILDALRSRDALSRSFVVMMSDHSQVTEMKAALDVSAILGAMGVPGADVERVISSGEQASIYLTDPARGPAIEALLEAHEEPHPVIGQPVRPFLVLNRAEMDSGIDAATGPLLEDGLAGNRRGEIYSEWSIDTPPPDIPRVRWPDLFVFNRERFQNKLSRTDDLDGGLFGLTFNGHHGSPQANRITMALAGPRLVAGAYDTPATLADVLPTLYPLMGLLPPAHVDGQPLAAVVAPE